MFAKHFLRRVIKRNLYNKIPHSRIVRERITPHEELWTIIEKHKIESLEDWKNIRNETFNTSRFVTPTNFDAIAVAICTNKKRYDLALSYLDFIKSENSKLNLATIGKYFKLLYNKERENGLSQHEKDEILALYENVRKTHPVLDGITLTNAVQAVSITNKWELCVNMLEELKVSLQSNVVAQNAVIAAAFRNNADKLAWKLLDEMLEQTKFVDSIVFSSYFDRMEQSAPSKDAIETLFNYLHTNAIQITNDASNVVTEALRKLKATVYLSSITKRGHCKRCNKILQKFDLSDAEFDELKSKIIQNVIVGKDVFHKTTSQELERFKRFVKTMKRFDVIIDGLNVAYSVGVKQSPMVTSGLVAAVVSHFVQQNKSVLVLGRKHMSLWPKQNWGYITKNATTFLTEDLSHDDPYLLYCALHSGKDTIIVTRDLMRSYKFLIKELHLKSLFKRWLAQRQYFLLRVREEGTPIFKTPLMYSAVTQKNGSHWHIPCMPEDNIKTGGNEALCIKLP